MKLKRAETKKKKKKTQFVIFKVFFLHNGNGAIEPKKNDRLLKSGYYLSVLFRIKAWEALNQL